MSASRRKSSNRSRRSPSGATPPGSSTPSGASEEPEELEELDELEAADEVEELDELPLLEADEDEDLRVRIAVADASAADDDVGADEVWSITLKKIQKPDVLEALGPSLRNLSRRRAGDIRRRRLLLRFEGETLIPSAVKQLIHDALEPHEPQNVTVQRGYGNEVLLDRPLPAVQIDSHPTEDGALRVDLDASAVPADELEDALRTCIATLTSQAKGQRLQVSWTGPRPDLEPEYLRQELRQGMAAAEAESLVVDGDLVLDRDLESRVRARDAGDHTEFAVAPGTGGQDLRRALDLALPNLRDQLAGRRVMLQSPGTLAAADRRTLVDVMGAHGVARLQTPGEAGDVLIPPLLKADQKGSAIELAVTPEDRSADQLQRAFVAEIEGMADGVRGRKIHVRWPEAATLTDDVEHGCLSALTACSPESVTYSFGGKNREPVLPLPLTFHTDSSGRVVGDLDTDQGKPPELVRAVKRRLRGHAPELANHPVELHVRGQGAVSRTLRRTLREELEAGGATSAELVDHGASEYLLPRALTTATQGGRTVVTVDPGPRPPEQLEAAVATELDDSELVDGAEVTLVVPAAGVDIDALAAAVARKGAARVLDGDGVQIHPPLFASVTIEGDEWDLQAEPGSDPAASSRQLQREMRQLVAKSPPAGATINLRWPGGSATEGPAADAIETLRQAGAAAIFFDDGDGMPLQVHPEEQSLADASAGVEQAVEEALAAADGTRSVDVEPVPEPTVAATGSRLAVLGQRTSGPAPMTMVGLACGDGNSAETAAQLQQLAPSVAGHRVLVVLLRDVVQVDASEDPELVRAVHRAVGQGAAALLVYRTAQGRVGHFEVVASRQPELPVGSRIADPRQSPAAE